MSDTFTHNHNELDDLELVEVSHYEYKSKFIPKSELPRFELFGWESKIPAPSLKKAKK